MIYKLLMILFSTFSYVFTNITVTDQNSHHSFDIRKVRYIGKIEIDDTFVGYVLKNNGSYLWFKKNTTGKNLQEYLLNYIQERISAQTKHDTTSEVYQYVYNLIHHEVNENARIKRLTPLIIGLVNAESISDESD